MSAVPVPDALPSFPPVVTRSGWRAAGIDLARRTAQLSARAATVLGQSPGTRGNADHETLRELAAACARELRLGRPDAPRTALLVALATELHAVSDELSERSMVSRGRQLAECERGLVRLQDFSTTAGLIDGVCDELVSSLGFERTMLARVEGGMWRPWKANASMLNEAWVADWIERSIPLDEMTLETRLLRERRPELVHVTGVPGIAQMVRAAAVSSYVVAPIMPGGRVVGFFHADHGVSGRACTVADRDLLWTFAEGFGHRYERTTLLEQLQARREQVRTTIAGVNEALDQLTDDRLDLTSDPEDEQASGRPTIMRRGASTLLEHLTSRELEVLDLVAAGARNAEIAQRLVITEGTVKSHVKNVLAKLGVVNRSQAIGVYLGVDDAPASGS